MKRQWSNKVLAVLMVLTMSALSHAELCPLMMGCGAMPVVPAAAPQHPGTRHSCCPGAPTSGKQCEMRQQQASASPMTCCAVEAPPAVTVSPVKVAPVAVIAVRVACFDVARVNLSYASESAASPPPVRIVLTTKEDFRI